MTPDSGAGADNGVSLAEVLSDATSAEARDALSRARRACDSLLDFAEHVVFPVQRDIGARWQRAEVSASLEHRGTALFAEFFPLDPGGGGTYPRPVIACTSAEGDDHTLSSRTLAAVLLERGHTVHYLGAGLPAPDLERFLESHPCDVVTVSCATTGHLVGAQRTIEAARAQGARVLCGGGGFGSARGRARRLGAHGWVPSVSDALHIIPTLAFVEPEPAEQLHPRALAEAQLLLDQAGAIALEVIAALPPAVESGGPAHLPELVTWSVRTAAAAVLLEDSTIITEHVAWLQELLDAGRGMGWAAQPAMQSLVVTSARLAPSLPVLLAHALD